MPTSFQNLTTHSLLGKMLSALPIDNWESMITVFSCATETNRDSAQAKTLESQLKKESYSTEKVLSGMVASPSFGLGSLSSAPTQLQWDCFPFSTRLLAFSTEEMEACGSNRS